MKPKRCHSLSTANYANFRCFKCNDEEENDDVEANDRQRPWSSRKVTKFYRQVYQVHSSSGRNC